MHAQRLFVDWRQRWCDDCHVGLDNVRHRGHPDRRRCGAVEPGGTHLSTGDTRRVGPISLTVGRARRWSSSHCNGRQHGRQAMCWHWDLRGRRIGDRARRERVCAQRRRQRRRRRPPLRRPRDGAEWIRLLDDTVLESVWPRPCVHRRRNNRRLWSTPPRDGGRTVRLCWRRASGSWLQLRRGRRHWRHRRDVSIGGWHYARPRWVWQQERGTLLGQGGRGSALSGNVTFHSGGAESGAPSSAALRTAPAGATALATLTSDDASVGNAGGV